MLGWGVAGLLFGVLIRSGLLSSAEAVAFTLVLTAPAFVVGIVHPPTAADLKALRQWVQGIALGPVLGIALFGLGYSVVLGFSAVLAVSVQVRHLLLSTVYATALIAHYVRNPRPYQTGRLLVLYIGVTVLIGGCAWLGREAQHLLFPSAGLAESLLPISEGLAALPVAGVNLFRARRAFFQ